MACACYLKVCSQTGIGCEVFKILWLDLSSWICQLQMMVAYVSLFSCLVIERIGQRIGLCCLFTLLFASFLSVTYERLVICFWHIQCCLSLWFLLFQNAKIVIELLMNYVCYLAAGYVVILGSAWYSSWFFLSLFLEWHICTLPNILTQIIGFGQRVNFGLIYLIFCLFLFGCMSLFLSGKQ